MKYDRIIIDAPDDTPETHYGLALQLARIYAIRYSDRPAGKKGRSLHVKGEFACECRRTAAGSVVVRVIPDGEPLSARRRRTP